MRKLPKLINLILFTGAVLVIALFIILVVDVKREVDYLVDKQLELLISLNDMYAQGLQTGQAIRNILINPNDERARKNLMDANKKFSESLNKAKALAEGDLKAQLNMVENLWNKNTQMKAEILNLIEQGAKEEA